MRDPMPGTSAITHSSSLEAAKRLIDAAHQAEQEALALERRYATNWFARWWKRIAAIVSATSAIAVGGWHFVGWYDGRVEAEVMQRQADEERRKAVVENTAAIRALNTELEVNVRPRLERVDEMQQLQLRIQIGDAGAREAAAKMIARQP